MKKILKEDKISKQYIKFSGVNVVLWVSWARNTNFGNRKIVRTETVL